MDQVRLLIRILSYLPHLPAAHRPPSRALLMSPPSSSALQQLHCLNRSSPDFHDQLCNVLYGREYVQCVPSIEGEDLAWLVDYLDKVRRRVALPPSLTLCSSQRRLSTVSILPVLLSGSVCASSKTYAAPAARSQHRTRSRLTF